MVAGVRQVAAVLQLAREFSAKLVAQVALLLVPVQGYRRLSQGLPQNTEVVTRLGQAAQSPTVGRRDADQLFAEREGSLMGLQSFVQAPEGLQEVGPAVPGIRERTQYQTIAGASSGQFFVEGEG